MKRNMKIFCKEIHNLFVGHLKKKNKKTSLVIKAKYISHNPITQITLKKLNQQNKFEKHNKIHNFDIPLVIVDLQFQCCLLFWNVHRG